jgi:hypothetical protein
MSDEFTNNVAQKFPNTLNKKPMDEYMKERLK